MKWFFVTRKEYDDMAAQIACIRGRVQRLERDAEVALSAAQDAKTLAIECKGRADNTAVNAGLARNGAEEAIQKANEALETCKTFKAKLQELIETDREAVEQGKEMNVILDEYLNGKRD